MGPRLSPWIQALGFMHDAQRVSAIHFIREDWHLYTGKQVFLFCFPLLAASGCFFSHKNIELYRHTPLHLICKRLKKWRRSRLVNVEGLMSFKACVVGLPPATTASYAFSAPFFKFALKKSPGCCFHEGVKRGVQPSLVRLGPKF